MMPVYMYPVPPAQMRVVDAADWHFTAGGAVIRVPYGYSDEETLAAMVHELVEAFLVQRAGITEASVDEWDAAHADTSHEAGALSHAPYHHQHAAATKVERKLAAVLGVNWTQYDHDTDRVYETVREAKAAHE